MSELRFEQLNVYQRAFELLDDFIFIEQNVPPGFSVILDQTRRQIWSLILNLAEGSCEYSRGDKKRFYRYALRSAGEAVGAFRILGRYPGPHQERSLAALERSREEVRMVTRMIVGPPKPFTEPLILIPLGITAVAHLIMNWM